MNKWIPNETFFSAIMLINMVYKKAERGWFFSEIFFALRLKNFMKRSFWNKNQHSKIPSIPLKNSNIAVIFFPLRLTIELTVNISYKCNDFKNGYFLSFHFLLLRFDKRFRIVFLVNLYEYKSLKHFSMWFCVKNGSKSCIFRWTM